MKNFEIIDTDFSGSKAKIYTVIEEGSDISLLEEFFEENAEYKQELNEILNRLKIIGNEHGARSNYFKEHEGSPGDKVAVLKAGHLRLFCLYIDCTVVCFGSGGYKPPEARAWQDDDWLKEKGEQMKAIANKINQAIVDKDITIEDNGTLTINYWDYE